MSKRMTNAIFVADSAGAITCGQGGGVGFLLEPSSVDPGGVSVAAGSFPVKVTFDQEFGSPLSVGGPNAYYTAAEFKRLDLSGCIPGTAYRVTIFRDKTEGISPSQQSAPVETIIFSDKISPANGVLPWYWGSSGSRKDGHCLPFDVSMYRAVCLRASYFGASAPGQCYIGLETWANNEDPALIGTANGTPQFLATLPISFPTAAAGMIITCGLGLGPIAATGSAGAMYTMPYKPHWVRVGVVANTYTFASGKGFFLELAGIT